MSINVLPDDVLIEMFHFYLDLFGRRSRRSAGWRGPVQVCQRWRNLVFGSPLHLDIKLHCSARTPLREMLDVWPALPISIEEHLCSRLSQVEHETVLAILELHQRVCEIDLTDIPNELLEQVGQTMQKPFPALTRLLLESNSPSPPELLNSFLAGSAPRLRTLELKHIPHPALPNLLRSTTDLRLETIVIEFYSPRFPHSESLPSPPSTRSVLPALTYLRFQGRCDYLEDLVASIDAPLLKTMSLSFFKRDAYDTPQLFKFISCTNQLRSPRRVDAVFYDQTIKVKVYLRTELAYDSAVDLEVFYSDWRLSPLAQLCHSSLSSLSTLERLDIRRGKFDTSRLPYNIEDSDWLVFLRRFASVKDLYITKSLGLPVMSALAAPAGDGMTVLPALQNIFLDGLQPSGSLRDVVDQLIASRQLSGHSISVHHWNRWDGMLQEMDRSLQDRNQQQHETSSQSTALGQ